MTQTPESLVKDKNCHLITVLQASLHYVWQMETYIADAESEGDTELADWFRRIQENNRKAGDQGKEMLSDPRSWRHPWSPGLSVPPRSTSPSSAGIRSRCRPG